MMNAVNPAIPAGVIKNNLITGGQASQASDQLLFLIDDFLRCGLRLHSINYILYQMALLWSRAISVCHNRSMKQQFFLPFTGFWLTFWGGDTRAQNHHHDTTSQKYAFDFIQTDESGKFFRTTGADNEDYFSFGQDIISPSPGIVIEVVDGLRDNKPGQLNSFNFTGNYVMLKHGNGLFSILGHLRQHSIVVKAGDKVNLGQKLGECGNSGYSTDPHLHFHVQDSSVFAEMDKDYKRVDIAQGQKIFFARLKLIKNGKQTVENYSPVKADIVSN